MTPLRVRAGGRVVFAARPDVSQAGACSLDLAALYGWAGRHDAAAWVLDSSGLSDDGPRVLVPQGLSRVSPRGVSGAWLRARVWGTGLARRVRETSVEARSAFWREWQRELRRHAGDERLPFDVRTRLRHRAERALEQSRTTAPAAGTLPRRMLREPVRTALPPDMLASASRAARNAGVDTGRPLVVIDVRRAFDAWAPAVSWLVGEGYLVVRIGRATEPIRREGVVDLSSPSGRVGALELHMLLSARFVMSQSMALQHVAYLTCTPTLLLDATDPFSGYPIRRDGVFTLQTPVNLDTGHVLSPADLLQEAHLRNLRNCGFRATSAAEVLSAAQEMHHGLVAGWDERPEQARFRERVVSASGALASRVALVAAWRADEGFIGDGRLARCQAERLQ